MLNSNIRLDLHIHSYASLYKEPSYSNEKSIVENSTKENIEILLDKLLENKISLFSITDHNRYDIDLYKTIIAKLKTEKYRTLHLLHGIEFDVKLSPNNPAAHIISIFDVKNDADMTLIDCIIKGNYINDKTQSYDKNEFENILKSIGLNTILIVHQRCSLDNRNGNHNSLSESSDDPCKMIQIGYINALEYQKPNVEGIIKNNLRDIDTNIALVTGSDCHDWKYYPKHDKDSKEKTAYFSMCKIIPSFKGLLLALTSPKTRFNRNEIKNKKYINSFNINGKEIDLDPGINVIIGENGSGKSSLFQILGDSKLPPYISSLKEKNKITVPISNLHKTLINQADLIVKFQKNELFETDNYFETVDTLPFENEYSKFSDNLKNEIQKNIIKQEKIESLKEKKFIVDSKFEEASTLYVNVTIEDLVLKENKHSLHRKNLANILNKLVSEINDEYYTKREKKVLFKVISELNYLYNLVDEKEISIEIDNRIRNIIIGEAKEYNTNIENISTSEDQEITAYQNQKNAFINDVVMAMQAKNTLINTITFPDKISGHSKKRSKGYIFTKETIFNNNDVSEKFLETMFVKDYRNINDIKNISSRADFQKAVYGCKEIEKIDEVWNNNFDKFIKWAKTEKSYIKEESTNDSIGNTLGEMSLIYYKFQAYEDDDCDVLMIDQPEDNISNNRIAEKLIQYLNQTRKQKQLILVTHNPLLVVNLDADNVIALNKNNNVIQVSAGCLEDEENKILDIVAKTLDGGKEMIEKRLKIYE